MCRFLVPALFVATSFASAAVDFAHQVVPILREHCAECHTGDKKKGGLSMNDRAELINGSENGPVIVVGNSAKSRLIESISSTDADLQMPPKGKRLTPEQVATLKAWIDEGLAWESGFAFKKPAYEPPLRPRVVALPAAIDGRNNAVDRITDAHLAKSKLQRATPLDDAGFMRRVHLDLIGLLPEPEALAAFLANKSPTKRAHLVDSLLASDVAYADHWLSFWNDLLRNDYTGTGFITGGRKQITAWLYDSLLKNKRYDQFARELIAPKPESAGFSEGIKWRGTVSAGQTVEIQFAQSICQTFLGINMKCASCHDSFIDRWKLNEAYGLAAVVSAKPMEVFRCDKPEGRTQKAAWLFPELGQIDADKPQAERQQQLAALMTHPQNGRFTRTIVNRLWHRLMGHGIVHPVDSMQTEPWSTDLLDYLAAQLAEGGYDLKQTMALICKSQAYQSQSQVVGKSTDEHGFTFQGPRSKRLTAEQFIDAVWQITGTAPQKLDAAIVHSKLDPKAANNFKLTAQWIWGDSAAKGATPASGETITLRRSFNSNGKIKRAGVVITCDNEYTLYVNGREMSSSKDWEKLDAIPLDTALQTKTENEILVVAKNAGSGPNPAGLFVEICIITSDGKEQRISTDSTWQWSSTLPNAKGKYAKVKPEWKPVTLVPALGAWADRINAPAAAYLHQLVTGDLVMVRNSLVKNDFLTRTLGRPNRDQIVSMRPNDLSTLEAIDLANGNILANTLATGAKNLINKGWTSPQALVQWLYRFALSRDPSADELAVAVEGLGSSLTEQGTQDLLWAVIMQPEFQLNH
jgi:Protein of unknown function (DUF1549)/Protein of unknown function (DUF1553)/Planctomycete cytochrome C